MKDRLIELVEDTVYENVETDDGFVGFEVDCAKIADHLLANGVIVPPCKVGQIVWLVRDGKTEETTVEKVVLKDGGLYLKLLCNSFYETTCRSIGKTVFLTKEEAKQALKEREQK